MMRDSLPPMWCTRAQIRRMKSGHLRNCAMRGAAFPGLRIQTYDVGTEVKTMKNELRTYSCRIRMETNRFATTINPKRWAFASPLTHRAIRIAMLVANTIPKSLRYKDRIWCRKLRAYLDWVLSGRETS